MRHKGLSLGLVAVGSLLVGCSERQVTAPPDTPAFARSAGPLAAQSGCTHVSGAFVFGRFEFTSQTTAVGTGTVQGELSGLFDAQYFDIQQRGDGVTQMHAHHTITRSTGTIRTSDPLGVETISAHEFSAAAAARGPTIHESIGQTKRLVQAVGADLGAAFDRAAERLYVVDGTGAYAGATGLLHTHGRVNFATLDGSIQYKGRVCVP